MKTATIAVVLLLALTLMLIAARVPWGSAASEYAVPCHGVAAETTTIGDDRVWREVSCRELSIGPRLV